MAAVMPAALAVLAVTACGASKPTSSEAAATDTAEQVCSLLRRWDNDLSGSLNATAKDITDADDPTTANQTLLAGFDELIALSHDHADEAADLRLPRVAERDRILEEIRTGVEKGISELEDEHATIEDLPPITIADQGGALGGAFIAVEKANASVEPRIALYASDTVKQAFADNDGCRQVVQL
jgi:hypothetical protein